MILNSPGSAAFPWPSSTRALPLASPASWNMPSQKEPWPPRPLWRASDRRSWIITAANRGTGKQGY
jgi:hypothetical protein